MWGSMQKFGTGFRVFMFVVGGLVAFVGRSSAAPINAVNTRPVAVDLSGANGEPSLQDILNTMFPGDGVDAITDQNAIGMFTPAALPATSAPTLSFEYSSSAQNVFGI